MHLLNAFVMLLSKKLIIYFLNIFFTSSNLIGNGGAKISLGKKLKIFFLNHKKALHFYLLLK